MEYKIESTSFIRIDDDWNIENIIPNIDGNIPVISCIGTSRDGKSTSLNLYANWLIKNYNQDSGLWTRLFKTTQFEKPFLPFHSEQTDDVVTNGIDYFIIPNKCMLIDCQGMQLKDAKYDHYLMLLTYLISNVIILTVRERLDLQILNNCLSVFSFLNEIPNKYKRKDKPILLIRIKDFQNIKQLKQNPTYLNELIDKWLEKSNDQYDQIKEAFKNTFDIHIIATLYPTMNEDGEVDIMYENFLKDNPSFEKYCEKIYELSYDKKAPYILNDNKNIEYIVDELKKNKNINWEKLDLYHQLTENELRKYAQENLINSELNDKILIDKMDGSFSAYKLYSSRIELFDKIQKYVYNEKFKDISFEIKDPILEPFFDSFSQIIIKAKKKNEMLAETQIKLHYDKYMKKTEDSSFLDYCVNKIMDYVKNKKEIFLNELKKVDYFVQKKYKSLLELDEEELIKLQKEINEKNDLVYKNIEQKFNKDGINKMFNESISEIMKERFIFEKRNNDIPILKYVIDIRYFCDSIRNKLVEKISKGLDNKWNIPFSFRADKIDLYYLSSNKMISSNKMKIDFEHDNEQKSHHEITYIINRDTIKFKIKNRAYDPIIYKDRYIEEITKKINNKIFNFTDISYRNTLLEYFKIVSFDGCMLEQTYNNYLMDNTKTEHLIEKIINKKIDSVLDEINFNVTNLPFKLRKQYNYNNNENFIKIDCEYLYKTEYIEKMVDYYCKRMYMSINEL